MGWVCDCWVCDLWEIPTLSAPCWGTRADEPRPQQGWIAVTKCWAHLSPSLLRGEEDIWWEDLCPRSLFPVWQVLQHLTGALGLLGKGNTHMTVGDIHKYGNADEPLGSSHQDLANPALSWPKGGVTDEGQGWWPGKNLPLATRVVKLAQHLGNLSTLLLLLGEHPLKGGVCTLSLGKLAIPYPACKRHYNAERHGQSAPPYRHTHAHGLCPWGSAFPGKQSLSLWKSRYRVRLCLRALAEAGQPVTRGTVWPPCQFLAVREGNTWEQRRKDCWAINRSYTAW